VRTIIAPGKILKVNHPVLEDKCDLVFDIGSINQIRWPEPRFDNETDRRTVAIWFKKFSRELNNYTTDEILGVLSPENLIAVAKKLPFYEKTVIPNNDWNMFFMQQEIKCTHKNAKFIRMALMCPSCGLVGGI
jgi:hypothetical protein